MLYVPPSGQIRRVMSRQVRQQRKSAPQQAPPSPPHAPPQQAPVGSATTHRAAQSNGSSNQHEMRASSMCNAPPPPQPHLRRPARHLATSAAGTVPPAPSLPPAHRRRSAHCHLPHLARCRPRMAHRAPITKAQTNIQVSPEIHLTDCVWNVLSRACLGKRRSCAQSERGHHQSSCLSTQMRKSERAVFWLFCFPHRLLLLRCFVGACLACFGVGCCCRRRRNLYAHTQWM